VLIEEGVISKAKAREPIATVIEVSHEMGESSSLAEDNATMTRIIEMLGKSLEAKCAG